MTTIVVVRRQRVNYHPVVTTHKIDTNIALEIFIITSCGFIYDI